MMATRSELFDMWAPPQSTWWTWTSAVLFAQLPPRLALTEQKIPRLELDSLQSWLGSTVAVVVDLPGAESIHWGINLAWRGYRPVHIFNASPGPTQTLEFQPSVPAQPIVVVEMGELIEAFYAATEELKQLQLPPDAPPAFLLDSMRVKGHHPPQEEMFDNRWVVFSPDFPSAQFLQRHGLTRALLIQLDSLQPQEDLAHVLLRWQEGGVEIYAKQLSDSNAPARIEVQRPPRFRSLWHRALVMLGLRRSSAGGFGSYIPESTSG